MHPDLQNEAFALHEQWSKAQSKQEQDRIYQTYLRGPHWKQLRRQAEKSQGKYCKICGSTEDLTLHHLQYRRWGDCATGDLMFLCDRHHEIAHKTTNPETIKPEDKINSHLLKRQAIIAIRSYEHLEHTLSIESPYKGEIASLKSQFTQPAQKRFSSSEIVLCFFIALSLVFAGITGINVYNSTIKQPNTPTLNQ